MGEIIQLVCVYEKLGSLFEEEQWFGFLDGIKKMT
jgi:hypothetical protein